MTDGQVKKKNRKEKKRDSLMLFRWSGVSVGRSVVPVKGESVCAVTVSKNGALVSLLGEGEGRGEERRNSRTKVETSRPSLDEERRT